MRCNFSYHRLANQNGIGSTAPTNNDHNNCRFCDIDESRNFVLLTMTKLTFVKSICDPNLKASVYLGHIKGTGRDTLIPSHVSETGRKPPVNWAFNRFGDRI